MVAAPAGGPSKPTTFQRTGTTPAAPAPPQAPAPAPASRPTMTVATPARPGMPAPAAGQASSAAPARITAPGATDALWHGQTYTVKERRMTFGRQYLVLDGAGREIAYCKQKVFKLKEDIRFFSDRSKTRELFRLSAQRILDFRANINVIDSATNTVVASIRRKGWKSLLKDEWMFFTPDGRQFGTLHEEGGFRAFLRRWGDIISTFVPARYSLYVGEKGQERLAANVKERLQFWGDTYDLHRDPSAPFDARLLVSAVVLADAMGVGGAGA